MIEKRTSSLRVWSRPQVDEDESGRITFDELARVCVEPLRIKNLGRYELRCFWRRVDADSSGECTAKEFTSLVYRVRLGTWPDLDDDTCDRVVDVLNAAAEKWHRASGNWYKIFKKFDSDASGELGFEEFSAVVRNRYPGVDLPAKILPDELLQGLWKRLDADRSGSASVQEFMVFMRRHGHKHSIHQLTEYAKMQRGLQDAPRPPPRVRLSDDDLRRVVKSLNKQLVRVLRARGVHPCLRKNWERLFKEMDAEERGRVRFDDFAGAARSLGVEAHVCSDRDLAGLWTRADADASGECTFEEFQHCAYLLAAPKSCPRNPILHGRSASFGRGRSPAPAEDPRLLAAGDPPAPAEDPRLAVRGASTGSTPQVRVAALDVAGFAHEGQGGPPRQNRARHERGGGQVPPGRRQLVQDF